MISPLLANIHLHYGLDQWPKAGDGTRPWATMIIVCYADDFIIVFAYENDARHFLSAMREDQIKPGRVLHACANVVIADSSTAISSQRCQPT